MATSASSGSSNPPLSLSGLALWRVLLIMESVALALAVSTVLSPQIGLSAAIYLALAVMVFAAQVLIPLLAGRSALKLAFITPTIWDADARARLASSALVVPFFVTTVLFITSINHRPKTTIQDRSDRASQTRKQVQSPPPPIVIPPLVSGIDGSWEKVAPKTAVFRMSDGRECGPAGDGEDTLTTIRKNRMDVPSIYHDVAWSDIAHVYFPREKVMPKSLYRWPADEIVKIMQFQDIPVRTEGYIKIVRPQAGSKESTNCNATKTADTDWHIAFIEQPSDPESSSIVTEVTPRVRIRNPGWTTKRLKPWINSELRVRFSGWLLFDPEHKNHLGRYRQTLWEIHPITKIEVQLADGVWVDLNTMEAAAVKVGKVKK